MSNQIRPRARTVPADPVLVHLANARAAGKRHNVDPADILAILRVEGGTGPHGEPVAPQDGLGPPSYGQFITSTGKALGVVYGNSASETDAIARYLNQLGYQTDRRTAFAKYNGGPGNPQYSYAAKVIAAAKRYTGLSGSSTAARTTATTAPAASPATPAPAAPDSSDATVLTPERRSGLLKGLVTVALVLGGAGLAWIGTHQITRAAMPT